MIAPGSVHLVGKTVVSVIGVAADEAGFANGAEQVLSGDIILAGGRGPVRVGGLDEIAMGVVVVGGGIGADGLVIDVSDRDLAVDGALGEFAIAVEPFFYDGSIGGAGQSVVFFADGVVGIFETLADTVVGHDAADVSVGVVGNSDIASIGLVNMRQAFTGVGVGSGVAEDIDYFIELSGGIVVVLDDCQRG